LGLPLWGALFIGNAVSVVLLSLLVPWSSRRLDWWLSPSGREYKTEFLGLALVIGIYVLSLFMAWQLS
jgi:antibiotic biosynthesis monooxygenase (ABM) superfamily enzyme